MPTTSADRTRRRGGRGGSGRTHRGSADGPEEGRGRGAEGSSQSVDATAALSQATTRSRRSGPPPAPPPGASPASRPARPPPARASARRRTAAASVELREVNPALLPSRAVAFDAMLGQERPDLVAERRPGRAPRPGQGRPRRCTARHQVDRPDDERHLRHPHPPFRPGPEDRGMLRARSLEGKWSLDASDPPPEGGPRDEHAQSQQAPLPTQSSARKRPGCWAWHHHRAKRTQLLHGPLDRPPRPSNPNRSPTMTSSPEKTNPIRRHALSEPSVPRSTYHPEGPTVSAFSGIAGFSRGKSDRPGRAPPPGAGTGPWRRSALPKPGRAPRDWASAWASS